MKNILVAPLDWGLGHATRCIPIIREILRRECNVSIAGSGSSLQLLQNEFPSLNFFQIQPYDPEYPPGRNRMVWKMASQIPKFFQTIRKEHRQIEKIIADNSIDLIISDNRYGCWSEKIPSVFITHQSNILMPKRFGILERIVRSANEKYISKFSECWIPDFPEGNNLTGQLNSFAKENNFKFIGPLSRFVGSKNIRKLYDVTAVLSGPEPQRTVLEKIIYDQFNSSSLNYCIVRGVFGISAESTEPHIFNNLNSKQLQDIIESSEVVIARSGYSTVMDMAALQKRVIFIPTPGQTEQEYLAKTLMEKGIAFSTEQYHFNLTDALQQSKNYSGFQNSISQPELLSKALDAVL